MLSVEGLTKEFGSRRALDNVTFETRDGRVTGFLGPNGAGKSTTMRALLGLIAPDHGRALVDGVEYAHSKSPLTHVGAVLDAKAAHKGRTAQAHLQALAATHHISPSRVEEVIEIAGLSSVRTRRAGSFSLGMSQRLNIAAALLGDPKNLVMDEPVNGLDPEGVRWVRDLCRYYASLGRSVLLSSHLMSEVALTVDDLVIIGRGQILAKMTVNDFIEKYSTHAIHVITPSARAEDLERAFATVGSAQITTHALPQREGSEETTEFRVEGVPLRQVAQLIANHQLLIFGLSEETTSLEDAYLQLTQSAVEYSSVDSFQPQFQSHQENMR